LKEGPVEPNGGSQSERDDKPGQPVTHLRSVPLIGDVSKDLHG